MYNGDFQKWYDEPWYIGIIWDYADNGDELLTINGGSINGGTMSSKGNRGTTKPTPSKQQNCFTASGTLSKPLET